MQYNRLRHPSDRSPSNSKFLDIKPKKIEDVVSRNNFPTDYDFKSTVPRATLRIPTIIEKDTKDYIKSAILDNPSFKSIFKGNTINSIEEEKFSLYAQYPKVQHRHRLGALAHVPDGETVMLEHIFSQQQNKTTKPDNEKLLQRLRQLFLNQDN